MCAYSLRKLAARLTGRDLHEDTPLAPFDQLDRELALHALPAEPSPHFVAEAAEHRAEAA
jgi:hypothetical protein